MLRVVDGCSGGSSREQTYLSRLAGYMILASESNQQKRPWKNSLTAIVFSSDMPRDLRVIIPGNLKNESANRHVLCVGGGQEGRKRAVRKSINLTAARFVDLYYVRARPELSF
jgi:hypothetical protein